MAPVDPQTLERVRTAVEEGLYIQAWRLAETVGPLSRWSGARARVLAGRLAMALGAGRLGLAFHLRAYRSEPGDPEALYYHARAILGSHGPWAAFRFVRGLDLPASAPAEVRADWLALRATIATRFRDFEAAEVLLAQAESLCPDRPWIAVEHAAVLEQQDRLEEALDRASLPLRHRPLYRPGVGTTARILERLGRPREALDLLERADAALESASLAAHRAQLLLDEERLEEAEGALARFEALSPLLDTSGRRWLAAQRSDVAYLRGDVEAARREAEAVGPGFYAEIARRLGTSPPVPAHRRVLAVPFVQQHHLTCSPASLASLTAFWARPVEHGALAREIAYDGTPGHREREWAREHGYTTREFRLTSESARALLDAGVPFLLVTQEPTSAHAQVVVGEDTRRGTILVRDPSWPRLSEMLLEGLLEGQAAHGPRCLALLPLERAQALAGLPLPEETAYDAHHRLQLRLLAHDREGAQAERDAVPDDEEHERLRLVMDLRLHHYDADLPAMLRGYEALLRRYPDDPLLLLRRADLLSDLGHAADALSMLEPLAHRRTADPVFALRLADARAQDARRYREAERLLERVLRARGSDASALTSLARLRWSRGQREEGLDLFRLAACSEIHNEGHVGAYVSAARQLDRTEEALAFLRGRVERLGDRSTAPACSLFKALEDLGRTEEAFRVLGDALARHPRDGELILFAAEAEGRYGRMTRARELVLASEGGARDADRRRTEARLDGWAGDPLGSLAAWRAVAEAEPLAEDAHRAIAELSSRLEGPEAARAHLAGAVSRASTNLALRRLELEWLRDDPARREVALHDLLERSPLDAWAHRERALLLSEMGRHEEAEAALRPAMELAPEDASTFGVRGQVLVGAGRRREAVECFRAAVARAVDYVFALDGLVAAAEGRDGKREALLFIGQQLTEQAATDAYLAFQRRAHGVLEPAETLSLLEGARDARPERWQAWSALADELGDQGRLEEASRLLAEATARFPMVATLWMDRARMNGLRGDDQAEIESFESAAAISPGWILPLRRLAEAHGRRGRYAAALGPLRRAAAADPADVTVAGLLGQALDKSGEPRAAAESFRRAIRLEPGYDWAWDQLQTTEGRDAVIAFARTLAAERPDDPDALLALASRLPSDATEERLAIFERVLAARPRHALAHDLLAVALAEAGRTDEALAACAPAAFRGDLPREMSGRRAWVLAQAGRRREAVAAMRELLERHPDYYWGARQLADWTRSYGARAEALDAAERLVHIAPESSHAFWIRAEARQATGDDSGARADFDRAVTLNPQDPELGACLLDLLFRQGALDDVETLLEQLDPHLDDQQRACRRARLFCARGRVGEARDLLTAELASGRGPGPSFAPAVEAFLAAFGFAALEPAIVAARASLAPEAVGRLTSILVGREERGSARRVLEILPDRRDAVSAACRAWLEASSASAEDRHPLDLLRSLVPADAEAWTLLARAECAGPATDRLALVDEALRRKVDHVEARDLRAMLLAELRRFDEARAACGAVGGETATPMVLKGRAAWVEAQAGRVQDARRAMRGILERHPTYRWGWSRLLDWGFAQDGGDPGYLADARRHADTFPGEAEAHGWLGDACRRLRPHLADAEAAFRRSLELDPGYEWGRLALADLLLEARRFRDADDVLAVEACAPPLLVRRIRCALAQSDEARAAQALLELLRDEGGASDAILSEARKAYAGKEAALEKALSSILEKGGPPARLGALWMEWWAGTSAWKKCEALRVRLRPYPALRRAALTPLVRALRDRGEHRRLQRLIRNEGPQLRADDFLWALVGHALSSLSDHRAVLSWLHDWRERRVTPWILNTVVIALRRSGRAAEAVEVSRRALELPPDNVTGCHRAWLGIERALDGDAEEAKALLAGIETPADVANFYKGLVALGEGVVAMRRASVTSPGDAFAEARRKLAESDRLLGRNNRDALLLRRRAVVRIARQRGGFFAWWWRLAKA